MGTLLENRIHNILMDTIKLHQMSYVTNEKKNTVKVTEVGVT